MFALSSIAFAVLLVGAVVAAALRSRRNGGDPATLLRFTRGAGVAYAMLAVVGTLIAVIQALSQDSVPVTIPVRQFWPEVLPGIEILDGPTATITSGGFERAEVEIAGLDTTARVLLAAGHLVQGATITLIAIVIVILCTRVLDGSPFRPMLSRAMTVAAAAVAIGGSVWQVCFQIAGSVASSQALTVSAWATDTAVAGDPGTDVGWPQPAIGLTFEFWPLLAGLVLAVLAVAFRHGERLQHDMEGLV
jgi:hypothetical protein